MAVVWCGRSIAILVRIVVVPGLESMQRCGRRMVIDLRVHLWGIMHIPDRHVRGRNTHI